MTDGVQTTVDFPLPVDVSWYLVGSNRLRSEGQRLRSPYIEEDLDARLGAGPLEGAGFGDVYPSIALFYYPVPLRETANSLPGERIVLLKLALTLTGITPAGRVLPKLGSQPAMIPELAPCIGAIATLNLAYTKPDSNQPSTDGIFIRDIYPKHQETVVNEITGQESLQRVDNQVSTTKSWNVGGSVGASVGPLNASVSAGLSESTTTSSERERSQRFSRQTEVHTIYHVLTGYHLAQAEAQFTIQPRPFEGETWELVNGFRVVEGIQESLFVASVPYDADQLCVEANAVLGFRGRIRVLPVWGTRTEYFLGPGPDWTLAADGIFVPATPPFTAVTVPQLTWGDRASTPFPQVPLPPGAPDSGTPWGPAWSDYFDLVKSYLDGLQTYADLGTQAVVLVTGFGIGKHVRLYWGADACADAPKPDPCAGGQSTVVPVELPREWLTPLNELRFHEIPIPRIYIPRIPDEKRNAANAHMRTMFAAVSAAGRQTAAAPKPLAATWFYQTTVLQRLITSPDVDPSRKVFKSVTRSLPANQRKLLDKLGVRSLQGIAMMAPDKAKGATVQDIIAIQRAVVGQLSSARGQT